MFLAISFYVCICKQSNAVRKEELKKLCEIEMFIQTVQRFLLRSQALNPICQRGLRSGTSYRDEKVVTNEDGSIVVCWHPEPKFPYELTQAVPREIPTETT